MRMILRTWLSNQKYSHAPNVHPFACPNAKFKSRKYLEKRSDGKMQGWLLLIYSKQVRSYTCARRLYFAQQRLAFDPLGGCRLDGQEQHDALQAI